MSKREFLEGLGLVSPEDKVTEIVVPPDEVEKVIDKEPEPSDTDEGIREQLGNINATVAGLEGSVKASTSVIQVQEITTRLEELRNRLDKLEETLEAEIEAAMCPECGKIVGWNNLPAEKYDEREVNPNKQSLFPSIIIFQVYGKRCPVCKHFEEAEQQKDIEAGKQLPGEEEEEQE